MLRECSACCHCEMWSLGLPYLEDAPLMGMEAENMIKAMPYRSHVNPWMALLDTCRIHGNVEMGELIKFLNWSLRTGHLSILLRLNLMEKLFILMEEDICFSYVITCLQLERGLSSSTTAQFCMCLDLLCLMSMLGERCCTEND
jgi:hypothetical protein